MTEAVEDQVAPEILENEGDESFDDLFGERMKNVRKMLEEAFEDEIEKEAAANSNSGEIPALPPVYVPVIPIRLRPPNQPAAPPPAHDLFGDAVFQAFQTLMSRGALTEFCHWMAYVYVSEYGKELGLNLEEKKFNPEIYETEGMMEIKKKFTDGLWPFVQKMLMRSASQFPVFKDKWTGIHVSADQQKGNRSKQEDRFVAYPNAQYINRGEDQVALLAVFDGHNGSQSSHYAAGHLFESWIASRSMLDGYLEQSLTSALANLDERMTKRYIKEHWKGGSTAVCCAIDSEKREMAFAWLGDSAAFVMDSVGFRKVTRDHVPTDPEECRRVNQDGGTMFTIGGELRVNGVLNITRSLGDVDGRPFISNVPESKKVELLDDDYLVMLVCDGITDVFAERELYQLVESFCNENDADEYTEIANYICKEAIKAGSMDNVTVVIAFVRHPTVLWKLLAGVPSSDGEEYDEYDENEN